MSAGFAKENRTELWQLTGLAGETGTDRPRRRASRQVAAHGSSCRCRAEGRALWPLATANGAREGRAGGRACRAARWSAGRAGWQAGRQRVAVTQHGACRRFVSYRNRAPEPWGLARTQVLAAHMPLPRRFKELAREILCWSSTSPRWPEPPHTHTQTRVLPPPPSPGRSPLLSLATSTTHHLSLDRLCQLDRHRRLGPRPRFEHDESCRFRLGGSHTTNKQKKRHAWPLPPAQGVPFLFPRGKNMVATLKWLAPTKSEALVV